MKKSTTQSLAVQPTLFDLDNYSDKRPLPLIVAQRWGFALQHHGEGESQSYALQDWVRGIVGGKPGAIREQVRRLLNNSDVTLDVTSQIYLATDGKRYSRPFVDAESLYRATQAMRPLNERERLSEVHRAVLDYLAKAGVFVDKLRIDPRWAAARMEGKYARSAFMAALSNAIRDMPRWFPGTATNDIYLGLFEHTYQGLCEALHTDSPRDKMNFPALQYLGIAEWVCAQELDTRQSLSATEAQAIIQRVAHLIGGQVQALEESLGIDIITGQKLLNAADAIRGA